MPIILLISDFAHLQTYEMWSREVHLRKDVVKQTKCIIITDLSSTFIQANFCNYFALINGYEDGKPVKGNTHQVRCASRGSVLCDLVPAEADVRSCRARTRAARNDVIVVATILEVNI